MWPRTGHDSAVLLGEDMGEPVPERSATQQRSAVLPGPDAALGEAPVSGAQAVAAKAASENFPVALRMLPRTYRRHLMAVYVFARTADDLGDQAPAAERSRLLAELEADVRALYGGGQPALEAVTGLQHTEHWQDVAEDLRAGRIYLPLTDMAAHGCGEHDLAAPHAAPFVRELMAFEVGRARSLIDTGAPLIGTLRGPARAAVAGYVAGGRAALAAIQAAGYDVLATTPRPGKARTVLELARAFARGR